MILVILSRDPDAPFAAREQQDLLATLAAFALPITLVFSQFGIKQLDKTLYPDNNLLGMLPSLGVHDIFIDQSSTPAIVSELNSLIPCSPISPEELNALAQSAHLAINL
jgi:hypothetical protein